MKNNINGIDVSECFYFIDHTPPKGQGDWCGAIHKGACKVYSKDCKYNKNCYFKQLKRLQQELDIKEKMLDKFMIGSGETLEKLQEENEGLKSLNDFNVQKIEVLQKENEELRQVIKNHPDIQEPYVYLYRQIKEQCYKLEKENEKLKERLKNQCI